MALTRGRYIGEKGLEKLKHYKYSVVDRSLMAPYFQPFWNRFVQIFPTWFAPNLITCSGAHAGAPFDLTHWLACRIAFAKSWQGAAAEQPAPKQGLAWSS